ncbi:hypothetical protein, partial [Mesorhizobium sp.]|uniref:hypothetical protein n=1 Tax=Mesorhizobium sp. TaxID=1871066 RepID=UPI002579AD97
KLLHRGRLCANLNSSRSSCRMTGLPFVDFVLVHIPPIVFAAVIYAAGSAIRMLFAGSPYYLVLAIGAFMIGTLSAVTLY